MTCAHGMPSPASCVDCFDDGALPPPPKPPPPTVDHMFTARFDGWCAWCALPLGAGTRIAKMSDDTYWHSSCVYTVAVDERRAL